MTARTNKATGQKFWGCVNFPACRGSRDTNGESREEREHRQRSEARDEPESYSPSERAFRNDFRRWDR